MLLRSYFHVAWLLAMLSLVLALRWDARRRTLAVAAVPVLACVLWYAKNEWLYGGFAGSTWLGMSLSRITLQTLPGSERKRLVQAGVATSLARLDSFGPLERYRGIIDLPPPLGIPVLDQPRKSTGGSNFNHIAYAELSRRYLRDDVAVVRAEPAVYLRGLASALTRSLRPVSGDQRLASDLAPLGRYRDVCEIVMCGRVGRTCLFTLLTNAVELGENNRFRFTIEPLVVVLLALFVHRMATRLRAAPPGMDRAPRAIPFEVG